MNELIAQDELSPRNTSRWFTLKLIAAVLLLVPAIWFSWRTIAGLSARRDLRTDLAELQHVRYGILSADQWRGIITRILNAQIDNMDLKGQTKALRPMVQQSLNNLLDNIQHQMTTPQPGGAHALTAPPFVVKMIVNSLRPHVPEYTNVVLAELAKSQNQQAFRESVRNVMLDAVKNTFSSVDMTTYNAILARYGCASGPQCQSVLANRIHQADTQLTTDYIIVLVAAALAFILLAAGRRPLTRSAVAVLMAFCITMLLGGILSPMIEVEVRITSLHATLLGTPVVFHNQSMYYRSKSVFEVFQTLIEMHRPAMLLVAVLVLLFSVVFPALKMMALSASLFRPSLLRKSRIVRLLAFDLSKWSMADVMALAIFMSFVAFNGVIESGLAGIRAEPAVQQLVIPTDSSRILPGYYLFVGFCIASIILSKKLERGIASASSPSQPAPQQLEGTR